MKLIYIFPIIILGAAGCATKHTSPVILPDLNSIGKLCDSLVSAGLHEQAASLYFRTAQDLGNSELFVYAGWQYGQTKKKDSALISINYAIDHGMSNPAVLETYQLDSLKDNLGISKVVVHRLDSIKKALSKIENFDIVSEPLDSFWPYFNTALSDSSSAKDHLKRYIEKGSFATKDYYHKRYENIDNMYRQMIQATPAHYKYTERFLNRDKIQSLKSEMLRIMQRLSEIYPHAVFPKVYLVPGILSGNGTQTELGLFAAAEMFVKSEEMPTNNLTGWQMDAIASPSNMIFVTAHELIHFQQSYSDEKNNNNLLGKVITEGVCDFMVELLSGDINTLDAVRIEKINYLGNSKNLSLVLAEFKKGMYLKDLSKWMYNGGGKQEWPSDMGYALGYKICKSFYDKSKNKNEAIAELLRTNSFEKILAGSEYGFLL